MPRNEKAVRPPTASVASIPLTASIRNCTAAPAAAPPGTMREIELPASWAVITGNQALVRRAMRWREKVQAKWAHLGHHGRDEPQQVQRGQLGPRVEHGEQLGQHQVEGHPGDQHHDRAA